MPTGRCGWKPQDKKRVRLTLDLSEDENAQLGTFVAQHHYHGTKTECVREAVRIYMKLSHILEADEPVYRKVGEEYVPMYFLF